jgi:hypothetical protein
MSANRWLWLISEAIKRGEPFAPGRDGADSEPWVSYALIAELTKRESGHIQNIATKLKLRRHPSFPGLVRWSDFCCAEDCG